ncbi:MAG: hypothetical protein AUJ21_04185 [Anaerolineae bacterium CG1_02_58_13]|nr:MAG: hypothetical protein AUJ21_04185 [Anaerolineae bacterium CG1_02_58_13]
MTKRNKESEPAEEIVQAEQPASEIVAVVEPPIQPMESAPTGPTGPTFGQRVGRFFAALLRLVIFLIFLAAIVVGLYFALPLVYQNYILPVQENTAQLTQLKTRLAQNEITIAGLQTKLDAAQTAQAQQAQSISDLDGKVQKIEEQIAARTQSLAALEQAQSALQAQNDATDAEVERQINLMKSMELLSRARLFMYQSNYGLARIDVQTARDLLAKVQPTAPADFADDLAEVIHRLDLTLANLPTFPVAASDDLDIAWQILLGGLPQPQAVPVTATPASETPAPEVTATPTPSATVEPTATP